MGDIITIENWRNDSGFSFKFWPHDEPFTGTLTEIGQKCLTWHHWQKLGPHACAHPGYLSYHGRLIDRVLTLHGYEGNGTPIFIWKSAKKTNWLFLPADIRIALAD